MSKCSAHAMTSTQAEMHQEMGPRHCYRDKDGLMIFAPPRNSSSFTLRIASTRDSVTALIYE